MPATYGKRYSHFAGSMHSVEVSSDNLLETYSLLTRGRALYRVASPHCIDTGMDRQLSQQRFLPQAAGCAGNVSEYSLR